MTLSPKPPSITFATMPRIKVRFEPVPCRNGILKHQVSQKNKRAQAPAPSRRGTRTRRQHPSVPIEDPPLPNGADPINIENKLHILPRYTKRDWSHPWYFYDIIEPAPQFRKIPDDYLVDPKDPHISEGEDSDDLSDTPGEDKLPVYTPGYMCVSRFLQCILLADCAQPKILYHSSGH